ncbi:MAG: FMN-binding protein [Planctomycetota bacterium]|nr:MAG: FMN-binding protein [Planctomycetota bacterium]
MLTALCAAMLWLTPSPVPAGGDGQVFLTKQEALTLAFGKAEVKRQSHYLTKKQIKQIKKLSEVDLPCKVLHAYSARDPQGKLLGTAYFDTHKVRTLPETLMILVDPQGKVKRLEILVFREPKDYIPSGRWYQQFIGRKLDKELHLKQEIRGMTGATLTARATTAAVRRVLAAHQVLYPLPKKTSKGATKKPVASSS